MGYIELVLLNQMNTVIMRSFLRIFWESVFSLAKCAGVPVYQIRICF